MLSTRLYSQYQPSGSSRCGVNRHAHPSKVTCLRNSNDKRDGSSVSDGHRGLFPGFGELQYNLQRQSEERADWAASVR